MEEKKKEEKIGETLLKVALGYQIAEVTEEYAEVDGALKLTKRKRTKRDVPPDLKAVQMLMGSGNGGGYEEWSDEELEAEKQRLLETLAIDDGTKKKKSAVKKTVKKTSTLKKSVRKVTKK